MTFIPSSNTSRSVLEYQSEGQILANVLWFAFETAITELILDGLNTALHTFWTSHLKPQIGGSVALQRVISTDQTTSSSPSRELIVSPPEFGTLVGSAMPLNVAICVTLRTGLRGRSFRGRTYLPGRVTSDENTPSSINLTTISNIVSAVSWLLTPANVNGGVWIVASHFTNKLPRPTAIKTPVSAISIDTPFDSMRRRLIGRGT
jgi:hypothetical protein